MAMTPEAKVKAVVVKQLKALGAYYFSPLSGGFGKSGVPDIVGCYQNKFFGIECKAGVNKPTTLQQMNLNNIRANGGLALVVNEDNMQDVTALLTGEVTPVMVPTCTRSAADTLVNYRDVSNKTFPWIAKRTGLSLMTVHRYYRVYKMYGREVFAPD